VAVFTNSGFSKTIAINQSESAAFNLGGFILCGVYIPATFTGTSISLLACDTVDGTYSPV
jgi:hypothetical protein